MLVCVLGCSPTSTPLELDRVSDKVKVDIHGLPLDPELNHKIEIILSDALFEFAEPLRVTPPKSVSVAVLSPDSFREAHYVPDWAVGVFYRGTIFIQHSPTLSQSFALKDTLRHEAVHAVVAKITDSNAPAWLDEGLAQIFEGQAVTNSDIALLGDYFGSAESMSLSNFERNLSGLGERAARVAYRLSIFASSRLVEMFSTDRCGYFLQLLATHNVERAFQTAFSYSLAQFESDLFNELKGRYETPTLRVIQSTISRGSNVG